jgi:2-(1,2-epoxy-1,2-dihydrophenyl)acetyl-CoA isomerase
VPDAGLEEAALAWADELAAGATAAMTVASDGAGMELPLTEALALEAAGFRECFGTADAAEGVAAFLGKRPSRFSGR